MKTSFRFVALSLCLAASRSLLPAQDGVLDLTTLQNYAGQTIPAYITRNNTPGNNAITNAGATLGRVLFYDKRLSRDNTISCASCHRQEHAFSDSATASVGVNGTTDRHGMRLINARFGNEAKFFWDERAASLEAQSTQPIRNHVEMGFSGADGDPAFVTLVTKLSAISEYRVLFAMTFGSATINETLIQRALAQFVRSIQSFDSRYDIGRATTQDNQNFANFTAQENAGKQLFLTGPGQGGAGCAACHRPPEFDIDPNSRNNGVIANRRTELLHHLLDEWIAVDRRLGLLLPIGTPTRRCLSRGFLLGLDQFDTQVEGAFMVLVQRVIQSALLGRVEQRAVGRIQVQQPVVALH